MDDVLPLLRDRLARALAIENALDHGAAGIWVRNTMLASLIDGKNLLAGNLLDVTARADEAARFEAVRRTLARIENELITG
jgi:hypothetical protein